MSYEKPKNIVEDVAALYANIVESQSEKVEQLDEIAVNLGGQAALAAKQKELAQQRQSQTRLDVLRQQRFGSGGAPSASASTAKITPTPTKPTPSAQGSQYTTKNLGAAQYAAFKGGGGDAAIKQGYSAGEVVARGRAALKGASGGQTAPANRPVPTGGATRPPVGGTPTSGKPAPTTPAPTTAPAPATPQRTFNPLMQRTFGYQTGNAPEQIAAASKNVPQATSDTAFKKSAQMVKSIKPSANLKMELDLFDVIKGHLLDEGYAETEEAAIAIMANMGEHWKQSIVEGESGRTAVGDGRTVGPLAGAARAVFSGNLPAGKVNVPTRQTGPNRDRKSTRLNSSHSSVSRMPSSA